jgi:hypothetical protein
MVRREGEEGGNEGVAEMVYIHISCCNQEGVKVEREGAVH